MSIRSFVVSAARAFALMLFGVALACGLGEIGARFLWHPPDVAPRREKPPNLPRLDTVAQLMIPNVKGVQAGVYFHNNSAGFRDREYALKKPAGRYRIVVAGDSFTMGQGVLEEQSYAALLEKWLNRDSPKTRFEVLNIGLGGLNIHQVVNRLQHVGMPYDPDLVVYGCTDNDIKGPAYEKSMKKFGHAGPIRRYQRFKESPSYLLRILWPHWESLSDLLWPRKGTFLYEVLYNYRHNPAAWHDFTAGLDRLAALSRKRNVPVVVFMHTTLFYLNVFHPFQEVYAKIEKAAAERGLPVIQSFPAFRAAHRSPESLWVSRVDFHPNPAAHEILARSLIEGLRDISADRRGYLPPRDS